MHAPRKDSQREANIKISSTVYLPGKTGQLHPSPLHTPVFERAPVFGQNLHFLKVAQTDKKGKIYAYNHTRPCDVITEQPHLSTYMYTDVSSPPPNPLEVPFPARAEHPPTARATINVYMQFAEK